MTLWELPQLDSAVLKGFETTTPDRYKSRLCELGFEEGGEVTCMRVTPFGGPRVYKIGDGVFSIDREMAKQILVKA